MRRAKIYENQIEDLRFGLLQRGHPIGNRLTRIAIESQTQGNGLAESSFVLDQQDSLARRWGRGDFDQMCSLAVVSNNVVHSGLLGKNGRYHTFHSVREGAPSEASS
jgi:hypothetical protein